MELQWEFVWKLEIFIFSTTNIYFPDTTPEETLRITVSSADVKYVRIVK